ncbi:nitroreductase family protein [Saliterribacillus persicus]|uniref:Nitroreductase n=1 Tax=Saliterribacillus persicus TaxID=930114 RepID=A0A368YDG9_9BACI|nr:nitroreductase family protein [Saliterribacillus persicus]RCW77386.1 nitroreductase [Saliterribacillus persicus]
MPKETSEEIRKADYDVDEIFLKRWSPRSYEDKNVSEEDLFSVLEAARWAPSSMNKQPWRFIVARTKEDREKFHSFIMDANRVWCEKAPALVLIISDEEQGGTHAFDTGAAWGFMSLQAAKKGMITHAMGGFFKDQAKEALNIPDHFTLHAVVAVGYQADKSLLSDELQEREKPSDRKPLSETVMEGTYIQS